jgi:nickel-dependent lactate racemase
MVLTTAKKCSTCRNNPVSLLQSVADPKYVLTTPDLPPVSDLEKAVRESLDNPTDGPSLAQRVNNGSRVGILFDDVTRPTPVAALLPLIISHLRQSGVRDEHIYLIHAPGLHISSPADIAAKLGSNLADWPRLADHDARHSKMTFYGITDFGTPVWANSVLSHMDFLIGLGHISPHMDAGFSGGFKIILPGVTSKVTSDSNHCLMISPASGMGQIDGNPVRQDIEQAGQLVGLDLIMNVLVNKDRKVTHVFAGHPIAAHRAGVRSFMEAYTSPMSNYADTAVACTCSKYLCSSIKAVMRANLAVKDGGSIIIVAPNLEGWAPPGSVKRFAVFPESYMTLSTEELAELVVTNNVEEVRHGTAAFNYKGVCEKKNVILVTGSEYGKVARDMNMQIADSVQEAIHRVKPSGGSQGHIVVLPDAENIYPIIHKA